MKLMFADVDMTLIADSDENLQYHLTILKEELMKLNMKTRTVIITNTKKRHEIRLDGTQIEQGENNTG